MLFSRFNVGAQLGFDIRYSFLSSWKVYRHNPRFIFISAGSVFPAIRTPKRVAGINAFKAFANQDLSRKTL
jgi:hypothetical protein